MSLVTAMQKATVDRLQTAGLWSKMVLPETSHWMNRFLPKKVQTLLPHHPKLKPLFLICETVNVCNSACVFCPYTQQTRSKGTMTMHLFEKIVQDYISMGGGTLSLTPMVGDVLLDKKLIDRLDILEQHRSSILPSITTNLFALERLSDDQVRRLIKVMCKVHLSCYGLSAEEGFKITKTRQYDKFVRNLRRFGELWQEVKSPCRLAIGFRLLQSPAKKEIEDFIHQNLGVMVPYGFTYNYANWGNSLSGELPGDAEWLPVSENREACLLPLFGMQVYWDGRVSACACCDYDASEELYLGNVSRENLVTLFNSRLNQRIWTQQESGNLPNICRNCTFHQPINSIHVQHPLKTDPTEFLGG
ncbi:MAG: radical SAM protein [Leptolyngbyaceae cyanobacterium SL_5_9]|nr:radical SAM protein [Leptolyngbyaceae cyanobacterium SL_5_9]